VKESPAQAAASQSAAPSPATPSSGAANGLEQAQTIEDAIRQGNFALAERKLEQYRLEYGKTPQYLFFLAKAKLGQKEYAAANELFKTLYYYYPVFMADRPDYTQFKQEYINPPLERARSLWNQALARLTASDASPKGASAEAGAGEGAAAGSGASAARRDASQNGSGGLSVQERDEIKKLLEQSAADFQRVLAIEPKHIDALTGLIQVVSEMGNAEEVLRLKERLEAAPAHWEGLHRKRAENTYLEARKAFREENLELANRILTLGIEGMPDDPNLLVLKAEILLKKQMFREAMACVDLVLRRFDNHSEALRTRGKIQAARFDHDFSRAQELLLEAEEQPTGSPAQNAKAREALDHFLEALNFDPANMLVLSGVYRCHMLLNNPLKAHQALNRIKELDPHFKIPTPRSKELEQEEEFMPDPCFVATRLFGPLAPETCALRAFRDRHLVRFALGRLVIAAYRRLGPALAARPERGPLVPLLRRLVRKLAQAVAVCR
jgi:hypothetical protein